MAEKKEKLSPIQVNIRWMWFFLLYFAFIILIACFGLVAEF
ncbi:MAG TPA: hypothetical protein V6D17_12250 [Candidatus Obscuribacterales bacterium]